MSVLEDLDGFEEEYVNSLKRKASDITIMNLSAIFNSGASYIGNVKIDDLLTHIINNTNTTSSLVKYIKEEFIEIDKDKEHNHEIMLEKPLSKIIKKRKKWWKFWE